MNIRRLGIILEPTSLAFEKNGVLNPGCIEKNGALHMLYRAVDKMDRSSIGYCRLIDNKVVERLPYPVLFPQYDYERQGIEDPRIVYFEGIYYVFYTAYDGTNAIVAYATSFDLVEFKKQGILTPQIPYTQTAYGVGPGTFLWEKDAFIFPKRINGKIAFMHRILPGIQIMYADSFADFNEERWQTYLKECKKFTVLQPTYQFEMPKIGGGCAPIETPHGWLLIYHAVEQSSRGRRYHAAAALLDLNNPFHVLGRLPYPLFSPQEPWEFRAPNDGIVFPSGASAMGNTLTIFYGAADTRIGAVQISIDSLVTELLSTKLA